MKKELKCTLQRKQEYATWLYAMARLYYMDAHLSEYAREVATAYQNRAANIFKDVLRMRLDLLNLEWK